HSQLFRTAEAAPGVRDAPLAVAVDGPAGDPAHAQAAYGRGDAMSAVDVHGPPVAARPNYRARRILREATALTLGLVILIWTLTPIYNIVMVALEPHGDVFTNDIWPANPSLESFRIVLDQSHWYLEYFWHQFGNSLYIGVVTGALTTV